MCRACKLEISAEEKGLHACCAAQLQQLPGMMSTSCLALDFKVYSDDAYLNLAYCVGIFALI
jgi:hypothetical protein